MGASASINFSHGVEEKNIPASYLMNCKYVYNCNDSDCVTEIELSEEEKQLKINIGTSIHRNIHYMSPKVINLIKC